MNKTAFATMVSGALAANPYTPFGVNPYTPYGVWAQH
jgi:hypothetical protein